MPPTPRHAVASRRLLRIARQEIASSAKPAQRRLSANLKRLDKQAARVRRQIAAGKLGKPQGKRILALMAKTRRQVSRLMSAATARTQRAVAILDREIRRLPRTR